MWRKSIWAFAAGSLLVASAAGADTIVLKNGNRITVLKATETGDKVTAETATGEISFSRNLVDRIERGPSGATPDGRAKAASVEIAPPADTSAGAIANLTSQVIRDGRVDTLFLSRLDGLANGGDAQAAVQAAEAHAIAAQFELNHGDMDEAVGHINRAMHLAPNDVNVLLNAAYMHLRQSEFTTALQVLDRVNQISPDSADALKLIGWADYGLNKIPEAVAAWKKSLAIRNDGDVAQALEKAQRDAETESDFREGQTNHFRVRYSGQEVPTLAKDVLATLEDHYDIIRDTLNYTPNEPIGVILYTNQQFSDITRAPTWVGALNDGRIRVPVQGLESVNDELSRVLKHELTHSFLQQKTAGRCPVWLQEGIAQWMEGQRAGSSASALVAAFQGGAGVDMRNLEASWMNLSTHDASMAYPWSLAVVEAMIEGRGMNDMDRLLDDLKSSGSTEEALKRVYHMDYSELQEQALTYLRSQYLH